MDCQGVFYCIYNDIFITGNTFKLILFEVRDIIFNIYYCSFLISERGLLWSIYLSGKQQKNGEFPEDAFKDYALKEEFQEQQR